MRKGSVAVGGYYVYILECSDGSLYAGWTTDPARRLREHNAGSAAKYTRGRRPATLVYLQMMRSRSAALRREWEIKSMDRMEKLALVESGHSLR